MACFCAGKKKPRINHYSYFEVEKKQENFFSVGKIKVTVTWLHKCTLSFIIRDVAESQVQKQSSYKCHK